MRTLWQHCIRGSLTICDMVAKLIEGMAATNDKKKKEHANRCTVALGAFRNAIRNTAHVTEVPLPDIPEFRPLATTPLSSLTQTQPKTGTSADGIQSGLFGQLMQCANRLQTQPLQGISVGNNSITPVTNSLSTMFIGGKRIYQVKHEPSGVLDDKLVHSALISIAKLEEVYKASYMQYSRLQSMNTRYEESITAYNQMVTSWQLLHSLMPTLLDNVELAKPCITNMQLFDAYATPSTKSLQVLSCATNSHWKLDYARMSAEIQKMANLCLRKINDFKAVMLEYENTFQQLEEAWQRAVAQLDNVTLIQTQEFIVNIQNILQNIAIQLKCEMDSIVLEVQRLCSNSSSLSLNTAIGPVGYGTSDRHQQTAFDTSVKEEIINMRKQVRLACFQLIDTDRQLFLTTLASAENEVIGQDIRSLCRIAEEYARAFESMLQSPDLFDDLLLALQERSTSVTPEATIPIFKRSDSVSHEQGTAAAIPTAIPIPPTIPTAIPTRSKALVPPPRTVVAKHVGEDRTPLVNTDATSRLSKQDISTLQLDS